MKSFRKKTLILILVLAMIIANTPMAFATQKSSAATSATSDTPSFFGSYESIEARNVGITGDDSYYGFYQAESYTKTYGDDDFFLEVGLKNIPVDEDEEEYLYFDYESSNENVVSVDSDGLVTITGVGSAKITVTFNGTEKYEATSIDIPITIKQSTNRKLISDKTEYTKTYKANDKFSLEDIYPEDDDDYTLTYSSSNTQVISFANEKVSDVTIKGVGSAIITVTSKETKNYAKATLKLKVTINKATQKLTGTTAYTKTYGDKDFTLKASSNDSKAKLTYKSSNTKVVTVSLTTGVVRIKGVGTAKITITSAATTNYLAAKAMTVNLTIKKATQKLSVTSSYTKTYGDKDFTLKASSNDSKAKLTYKSNNTKVVTVSATTGVVRIKGTGTAKITVNASATATANKATAKTITITVKPAKPAKMSKPSLSNIKTKKLIIKWNKTKDSTAKGYIIEYATTKTFTNSTTKTKTISSVKTTQLTLSGLTKNKTYYVRIRAYTSKNVKGDWSNITSKKITK